MRWAVLFLCACALAVAQGAPVEGAWELLRRGQHDQAVVLLRKIIQEDARNADARLLLGSVLQEDGDRESIALLREAVRLRPNSAEAHNALGEALNEFGDATAARPEFEAAAKLNPAFAQARVNLGLVLLQAGQIDAAGTELDAALQLLPAGPDAAYPHYLRAKVYTAKDSVEQAAQELKSAVTLRPDFAEAWSDLGEARKTLLDSPGALAAFERAGALNPRDPVIQTRLGSEYFDQGNISSAVEHLREAVRQDSKNQTALYKLQLALRQTGNNSEADAVKRQLTKLLLDNDKKAQKALAAIQMNNQGAALEKTGDLKGASEKYRAALQLNPEHVGIRVNLGVALLRLGRWDEGMAELRDAARRDPANAAAQTALKDAARQRSLK